MSLGTCCYIEESKLESMDAKSVKIEGVQRGLVVNFEVVQTFKNSKKDEKEIRYVFPNDNKICIYDMTFVVGEEIIKPKLQEKEEAKKTFKEAVDSGHTAVYGSNINHGMTELKLGNLPAEAECKVILKIAFTAQKTNEKNFFIKFPLDVYSTSGSKGCIDYNLTQFSFQIQTDSEIISNVTSNVINGKFDKSTNTYSINDKIENHDTEKSIIITFESKENIQSSALVAPSNLSNYESCALIISPNLPMTEDESSEFIFVVDCSGSMSGSSIRRAGECLAIFIRSIPPKSFFNIYRFGSSFDKLFESSTEYTDKTAQEATNLANSLKADLGCTELYDPLKDIFDDQNRHGQRQIFIMTDGEIDNVEKVLNLISSNSNNNRCFTIGIGRGCDAGLVEGMARSSGGKSDFVQEGDSISEKVIPQLESSLHPSLNSIEIHLSGENNDTFEISPFPIPPVNPNGSAIVYLRDKKKEKSSFEDGFLISGNYGKETVEIPIEKVHHIEKFKEDKFGCSGGKNIGDAILPLFAFNYLQGLANERRISDEDVQKAIEVSISSGVLCKYTGYVGMSKVKGGPRHYYDSEDDFDDYFDDEYEMCCDDDDDDDDDDAGDVLYMAASCKCGRKKIISSSDDDDDAIDDDDDDNEHCCAAAPDPILRSKMHFCAPEPPCCAPDSPPRSKKHFCAPKPPCCAPDSHKNRNQKSNKSHNQDSNKSRPPQFSLLSIANLQNVSGFWDDLNAINEMLGLNVKQIDGVDVKNKKDESKCIATILAIAALRVKLANEKNSWSMIEKKAINWLKMQLSGVDVEQIIEKAKSLI